MLVFSSRIELDAFSAQVLLRRVRELDSCFAVRNKLSWWPMSADPQLVDRLDESVIFSVVDLPCSVSMRASVDHVEDDVLLVEHKVALDLGIE